MSPVVALTFSASMPGLLAAKASATETPATGVDEPAVTLSLAGSVMLGPVGGGVADVVAPAAAMVMAMLFSPSIPAWSQMSMLIESEPALLPAV